MSKAYAAPVLRAAAQTFANHPDAVWSGKDVALILYGAADDCEKEEA